MEVYCFFFFQAEDGIRDVAVTGVQTCALPIYDEIGLRAHADHAAVAQLEPLCRQSRHLVHGLGQPEDALLARVLAEHARERAVAARVGLARAESTVRRQRSEEHTSELQSRLHLVCRLLLE